MIYIQSNKERTLPHHFDCACAMYGAMDSGLDYRLTSFEEVESGKFDARIKQNLFVGSTEFMREVFKRVGKNDVSLPMNADRPCEIITLGEAHKRVADGERLFIKPVAIKLFTGLVLDGATYSCLKGLPEDTQVMAYKPFDNKIISEWRLYIHHGKIVDARNYSGDFRVQPDYDLAEANINGLELYAKMELPIHFPCAYTMDVACFKPFTPREIKIRWKGMDDEIIEFNSFFAIGNYGMPNDLYLRLLTDRYFEIMKQQ